MSDLYEEGLVCRVNCDDDVDMSEYDIDRRKNPLQKAAIKKRRK